MSTAAPSPPTERVVRVLDAVAGAGANGAPAAAIARQTAIAVATCHAVLAGLQAAGFVRRDPATRRYRLGAAAVALGDAARRTFPEVLAVHDELQALAADTGLPCTAAAVLDGDIVVLDEASARGRANPLVAGPGRSEPGLRGPNGEEVGGDGVTRTGQRVPLAPPFGALHVAGADAAAIDTWLARSPAPLTRAQRAEHLAVLADLRALGYAVSPLDPAALRLRAALADVPLESMAPAVRERTEQLLAALPLHDYRRAALRSRTPLPVNTISAPVRDATGRIVVVLSLHVLADLAPTEIRRLGSLLVTRCVQSGQ